MTRRSRWLAGVALFVLIVAPVVWAMGSDWLLDHAEDLWLPILILAAAGYFLLGFVTRSFLSVALLPLPVLLMWLVESPPEYSDGITWTAAWFIYTPGFAFVWVMGAALGWMRGQSAQGGGAV